MGHDYLIDGFHILSNINLVAIATIQLQCKTNTRKALFMLNTFCLPFCLVCPSNEVLMSLLIMFRYLHCLTIRND